MISLSFSFSLSSHLSRWWIFSLPLLLSVIWTYWRHSIGVLILNKSMNDFITIFDYWQILKSKEFRDKMWCIIQQNEIFGCLKMWQCGYYNPNGFFRWSSKHNSLNNNCFINCYYFAPWRQSLFVEYCSSLIGRPWSK